MALVELYLLMISAIVLIFLTSFCGNVVQPSVNQPLSLLRYQEHSALKMGLCTHKIAEKNGLQQSEICEEVSIFKKGFFEPKHIPPKMKAHVVIPT